MNPQYPLPEAYEEHVDQKLVKLQNLARPDRVELLRSTHVYLVLINKASKPTEVEVVQVPRRAIMAISAIANTHFMTPTMTTLNLSWDAASPHSVRKIINWMENTCLAVHYFDYRINENWLQTVKAYQAMQTLGMEYIARPLVAYFRQVITNRMLAYHEISALLIHVGPNDPVYQHLAHTYAMLRYRDLIMDKDDFDRYLDNFPEFKENLAAIDQRNAAGKLGEEKKGPANQPKRKTGRKSGASLGNGQGKINIVTAEEARKMRGFK